MRLPIRWLKEFVDIPISTEALAHCLTMSGIEVAAIEKIPGAGLDWTGIVVGEIVKVEAHPNADKLVIATVDYGQGPLVSVTGAPNIRVGRRGMRVPIAKAGARIVNAYGAEPAVIEVKGANLRGVDSQLVLCSEKELGLSEEHGGVLLLDKDAPVGASLKELLGDEVLEIELTPNLGRCLSVVGVAREVAALTGGKLHIKAPKWKALGEPSAGQASIEIGAPDLCPRYSVAIVRDVAIKESPFWMRYRLMLAGMRPINSIVDITNYVMLEWGQPLHAFDYDRLAERAGGKPPKIIIRRAKRDEKLVTLDKNERQLKEDMLVIADERGAIALAGVMGGLETEVSDTSRNILLESANFHAINTRRTANGLQLPSEASHRFTRGVPVESTEIGAMRAAELMRQISKGKIASGLLDSYPAPKSQKIISLPLGEPERLLGISFTSKEISNILKRLDFKVIRQKDALEVSVPHYRLDVEIPADLVEEIARVIGYDKLPATRMSDQLPPQKRNRSQELEERARDILSGIGLNEVINYSLTSLQSAAKLDPACQDDSESYIELANPISTERSHMRKTLMNGLLESIAVNQRQQDDMAIFEIGRVFLPNTQSADRLPNEPRRVGIALAGLDGPSSWAHKTQPVDFYDLKGIVERMLRDFGIQSSHYVAAKSKTLHPGRSAEVRSNGKSLGILGEVHPLVAKNFDLKGRLYLAELDLEALIAQSADARRYAPLPKYPGIRQDIAVVVDQSLTALKIEELIWREGGDLLCELNLFDVYAGEQVPPGKKSLAYALLYRSDERTLKDEEAQAVHQRIQRAVEQELGAQVRGVEG